MPDNQDWALLTDYLGGEALAGGKMKEAGFFHWQSPNSGATNSSGFFAMPGGYRSLNGGFDDKGKHGFWWSATEQGKSALAHLRIMAYNNAKLEADVLYKEYGFSVRCLWNGPTPPVLSTRPITGITQSTAISGGNISHDGYSPVTSRGLVWSTNAYPDLESHQGITMDGQGVGEFESQIDGLAAGTLYYIRAYATNTAGEAYGQQEYFYAAFSSVIPGGGLTDIDGNEYATVIIGEQEWMAENLKTSKFRNGEGVSGSWFYYNDTANADLYGKLYDWYAVDDARGLCPQGWYVPGDAEWTILTSYLGGHTVAGGAMKEASSSFWKPPNTGATNSSGFTAMPGGSRHPTTGIFYDMGSWGSWWSATSAKKSGGAISRLLTYDNVFVSTIPDSKATGLSVRCVKQ